MIVCRRPALPIAAFLFALLTFPTVSSAIARHDLQIDGGATNQERLELIAAFLPTYFHIYNTTNVRPATTPAWLTVLPDWVGNYSLAEFVVAQRLQLQATLHMVLRQNNYQSNEVRIGIDGAPLWNPLVVVGSGDPAEGKLSLSYASDAFRAALVENLKSGIVHGVRTFEFQDTAVDYYSDFSDLSVQKFQMALANDPRLAAHKAKLVAKGFDPLAFNVRSYAYQTTTGSQLERQRQFLWTRQDDVSRAWLEFCFLQMTDLLSSVIGTGKTYGATMGATVKFFQHYLYPRDFDIRMASLFDGLWIESPYNEYAAAARVGGAVGLPVNRYYPPSGIAGAAASVVSGFNGRSTPIWLPWGVAYPELAYKRGPSATVYSIWLAEIYASSGAALLHTSFQPIEYVEPSKLGQIAALDNTYFDPTRIIAEPWHVPSELGVFTRFLRQNSQLFNGNQPIGDVLLLKSASAYRMGAGSENIYGWAELLADAHVPYVVRLDGVGMAKTTLLAAETLAPFSTILAMGLCSSYSDEQIRTIGAWTAQQGTTLLVEDVREAWAARLEAVSTGQVLATIQTVEDLGTAYQNNARADATVAKAAALFPASVETNLNKNCLVRLEKNTFNGKPSVIVHIVNRNYNWEADTVTPQTGVTIKLGLNKLGITKGMVAKIYSPSGGLATQGTVTTDLSAMTISLPEVGAYTAIHLHN